jgi:hypothetical protein
MLIERGLPGGSVKREFKKQGHVCTIELRLGNATGHGPDGN